MAIDTVVEEVATNLEEAAAVTRRINAHSVGLVLGGAVIGLGIGFYLGYRWNKEKIRAEAFQKSEEEVAKIREVYQQKTVAATPKPAVEELIEEKGYDRPLPAPVPVREPVPPLVSAPPVVVYDGGRDKYTDWDYPSELKNRSEDAPYIIHQDEFHENGTNYSQVTWTYYAGDSVLTDEDESRLNIDDFAGGVKNLRFGHGSDDIDVVFIRNDRLSIDAEVCRSHKSWEEEVLGLENAKTDETDED